PRRHRRRPGDGTPDAGAGRGRVVEGGARLADLARLQPDGPRPHHRLRLLRTAPPARPRLGAAALGGGRPGAPAGLRPRDHARALRRTRRRARGHGRSRVLAGTAARPRPPGRARPRTGRPALPARVPEDARGAEPGPAEPGQEAETHGLLTPGPAGPPDQDRSL